MKEKPSEGVRLDKWLWAARFYKTRADAREMVEGGKVHYNGQRSKPSKQVEVAAELTLRQGNDQRTIVIEAISDKRGPATVAHSSIVKRLKALRSGKRSPWRAK